MSFLETTTAAIEATNTARPISPKMEKTASTNGRISEFSTILITAGSASFYLRSGNEKYWTITLSLYPISWISFGIGIFLMLTIVAYGQSVLVFLQITPVILLVSLIFIVSTLFVLLTYLVRKKNDNKEIRKIETTLQTGDFKRNKPPYTIHKQEKALGLEEARITLLSNRGAKISCVN